MDEWDSFYRIIFKLYLCFLQVKYYEGSYLKSEPLLILNYLKTNFTKIYDNNYNYLYTSAKKSDV